MFRFTHFTRVEFAGVEVDAVEAADCNVGVVFDGGIVEFCSEIRSNIIITIDKADEFAFGFFDAVFATAPDALVLLVDDDDFVAVFFAIILEDFETIIGRAVVDKDSFDVG